MKQIPLEKIFEKMQRWRQKLQTFSWAPNEISRTVFIQKTGVYLVAFKT